jgi:hypothetical protein
MSSTAPKTHAAAAGPAPFTISTSAVLFLVLIIAWACFAGYSYSKDRTTTRLSLLCQALLAALGIIPFVIAGGSTPN